MRFTVSTEAAFGKAVLGGRLHNPVFATYVITEPSLLVAQILFHGYVNQSQAMDHALRRAGKQSHVVVYPKLGHQLSDGAVRASVS